MFKPSLKTAKVAPTIKTTVSTVADDKLTKNAATQALRAVNKANKLPAFKPTTLKPAPINDKLKQIKEEPIEQKLANEIDAIRTKKAKWVDEVKPTLKRASLPAFVPKAKLPSIRPVPMAVTIVPDDELEGNFKLVDTYGNIIELGLRQQEGVDKAVLGQDFCLVGKAGTGKTTTNQSMMLNLFKYCMDRINIISYRIVNSQGARIDAPSVAVVSYTNRATNNMRRALMANPELAEILGQGLNITTVHNLLEYTRDERYNEELDKMTMQYFPTKDKNNKLDVTILIVEEATMIAMAVDKALGNELMDALNDDVQVIYLGDINQLPAIGGKGALNYALTQAPVIELTQVHRQAMDNPIIRQALNCIDGKAVTTDVNDKGVGVRVMSMRKNGKPVVVTGRELKLWMHGLFSKLIGTSEYNHETDMILCPYNKSDGNIVGTEDINANIATTLARHRGVEVYEIIANYRALYLSVGDRVYVNKLEGIVTAIATNGAYMGKAPQDSSKSLTYYGINDSLESSDEEFDLDENDLASDFDYSKLDISELSDEDGESATRKASHIVDVELEDGRTVTLEKAADFDASNYSLGYALTVHKAQGSEWPRVYFVLHDCHSSMKFRELVYTAMTRPRENLIILSQPHTLAKAIANPRIKGTTLEEKIEFFNGGYLDSSIKVFPRMRGNSRYDKS